MFKHLAQQIFSIEKLFVPILIFAVLSVAVPPILFAQSSDKESKSAADKVVEKAEEKDKKSDEESKDDVVSTTSKDSEDNSKENKEKNEKKESDNRGSGGPELVIPQAEKPITGVEKVEVKAEKNSVVDLHLQTTEGNVGTVYLGRVKVDDKEKAEFKWNSKNTPNGDYKLFGTVNKENNTSVIAGPLEVKVDNTATAIAKRVEEKKESAKPVSTKTPSATSRASIIPSASPVLEPEATIEDLLEAFEVVTATTQDIVFPSEFDPNVISQTSTTQVTEVKNTKNENQDIGLTFSGRAEPNTIITLLVFSNPIVVTVKADANGLWTYTLEKPLTPGKHAVYAVSAKNDGTTIRSEVADFFIAPALAASSNNESLQLTSATEDQSIRKLALYTTIVIGSGIAALLVLFRLKKKSDPVIHDNQPSSNKDSI